MIQHTDISYGPESRNRLDDAGDPSAEGARAVLESFYYAFNHGDHAAMARDWADHPLVQLNNPLGGILRGGDSIAQLFQMVFAGDVVVRVTFNDVVEYLDQTHAVFAGHDTGTYTVRGGQPTPLEIRTTRYFRYEDGRWRQYHYHGSIDDADALLGYQDAFAEGA